MNNISYSVTTKNTEETVSLGERLGSLMKGGEVLVMQSDVGGGKTTLVKGIAKGAGFTDSIMSPTFIVEAVYEVEDGPNIHHYDFYRIDDPGIMRRQLQESVDDPTAVTVIEWSGIVKDVLPANAITITINKSPDDQDSRILIFELPEKYRYLKDGLEK